MSIKKDSIMTKAKTKSTSSTIALNKKAFHDYSIEETFEAGLVLEGWEVKSIREGRVQLRDCYVVFRGNEAFLFGAHFSPLASASTHVRPDAQRTRKLLLHRHQISKLMGRVLPQLLELKNFNSIIRQAPHQTNIPDKH